MEGRLFYISCHKRYFTAISCFDRNEVLESTSITTILPRYCGLATYMLHINTKLDYVPYLFPIAIGQRKNL